MRASTRPLAASLAFAVLAACGGVDASPREPVDVEAQLFEEETVAFGADGLTPALAIPPFEAESLTLWASSEAGTCFALASLEDGLGRTWVSKLEPGPACVECEVRTSLAKDEALFVLPAGEEPTPRHGLSVRFGLMDCETLTPVKGDGTQRLRISWAQRERVPSRGRLSLRFLVSRHSMLFGQPERQHALLDALNRELDGLGLEATVDEVVELPETAAEARFWITDLAELEALRDGAPAAREGTVDVVFAGCLRFDDPFFGPPVPVSGFTPRVVGGAGPGSAVFMPGLRCDSFGLGPTSWPLESYAHVLAHELGHFLGLFHTVESDGTTDLLDDTSEHNTMHHNPSLAEAKGWSPAQGRNARSHPWVRERAAEASSRPPSAR